MIGKWWVYNIWPWYFKIMLQTEKYASFLVTVIPFLWYDVHFYGLEVDEQKRKPVEINCCILIHMQYLCASILDNESLQNWNWNHTEFNSEVWKFGGGRVGSLNICSNCIILQKFWMMHLMWNTGRKYFADHSNIYTWFICDSVVLSFIVVL
jgi:hypothetical protein